MPFPVQTKSHFTETGGVSITHNNKSHINPCSHNNTHITRAFVYNPSKKLNSKENLSAREQHLYVFSPQEMAVISAGFPKRNCIREKNRSLSLQAKWGFLLLFENENSHCPVVNVSGALNSPNFTSYRTENPVRSSSCHPKILNRST